MDFLDNPDVMTPEQRLRELAAILAAGYLRLRTRQSELSSPENSNSFGDKELDVSGHPSSCLDNGLTGRDPVQEEVPE
ncbi:MAG: hypothetical protein KJ970_07520 [Candidatus Eisenbacteria bacterium]|uniref:Uncharacterized protein n=1 Tax=Eiseniibacteriota bacterium TaxID=2212470 RepID=A0A948RWC4_UNCEI|nr:hypothetical protein [Candidatus Eisenbacteria bacterium]MBU1949390.1 hypothetical protein [Candidatus Eisenbacteria bacterium]MBU2690763.1 hypothetical protein [Candidatus Eisenbacteria bacterium]